VKNGVTVELHDGFVKLLNDNTELILQKSSSELLWTIRSKIEYDIPTAMVFKNTGKATVIEDDDNGKPKPPKKKAAPTMHIMDAHERLGHPDEKTTHLTVKAFGWTVVGSMEPCASCLEHKAKAKGVSHKPTTTLATKTGERLFLDTTGPYAMSAGGTKYDVHIVDQKSRMGWVAHVTQRNAVPKVLEQHCDFLTGKGYAIKHLRCDNAGEHQTKLKKVCATNGIDLEYTPPNTPQMNGVVERRIASTNHSTFTMLHGSKLKEQFRLRLRAEAKTTANKLKNLYVTARIWACRLCHRPREDQAEGSPSRYSNVDGRVCG
jgi:hypothetical protein